MLSLPLDAITEDHLNSLISDSRPESRTMEYKRALPGTTDAEKKEFLGDVSSLANTIGGDLLFGIMEANGVPTQIVGVKATNIDETQRRLNSIIEAGLAPRIRYSQAAIPLHNGDFVLIIRVDRSWVGPHRIVFKDDDRFYGRNSAGKYKLDVSELRQAFSLSETTTQRIRSFRNDRIIALRNNDTPVPFMGGGKLILHILPLASFAGTPNFDVTRSHDLQRKLPTIGNAGWNSRINLDGLVTYSGHEPANKYTQLFRNGAIESVHGEAIWREDGHSGVLLSKMYEPALVEYLPFFFDALREIGCPAPVYIAITMTEVKNMQMETRTIHRQHGIDRDVLFLPEVEADDLTAPPAKILKPLFDMIWNACGYTGSINYDSSGDWSPKH